ncbi:potassium transporter-domain-containing protein [Pavlovales sp. CCMP2436]|nr:potassium transporter-domain-containing protein [Pavlovales sp. CCMP2436]
MAALDAIPRSLTESIVRGRANTGRARRDLEASAAHEQFRSPLTLGERRWTDGAVDDSGMAHDIYRAGGPSVRDHFQHASRPAKHLLQRRFFVRRDSAAHGHGEAQTWGHFAALTLGATGVVFGDIGTSPLYCFSGIYTTTLHTLPAADDILGTFSMIFWALTLVVCIKYVGCVMRVSHHGEGGTFALLQTILAGPKLSAVLRGRVTLLAMLGCSLLIGDGAITPAMSVLGALEGLPVGSEKVRSTLAVCVLLLLFSMQKHGSALIGRFAGPVMVLWFLTIGALGVWNCASHPEVAVRVLRALNPRYLVEFWLRGAYRGADAWRSLGGVVLCVTGAEALYADMGHFGCSPIRATWFCLVYPSLVLQYAGQATVLTLNPAAVANPFYAAVPPSLLWPVLALATCAAVIASQALISGVFALLAQGHALQFVPRILVKHTNPEQRGQVFISEVIFLYYLNRACVAVTGDALVTTALFAVVVRRIWKWNLLATTALVLPMLFVDLLFWYAAVVYVPPSLGTLAVTLGCLPGTIVLLTVKFESSIPFVLPEERTTFDPLDAAVGAYRIVLHVGYAEACSLARVVPLALARAAAEHAADFPALLPLLELSPRSDKGSGPLGLAGEEEKEEEDSEDMLDSDGEKEAQESTGNVSFVLSRLTYSDVGGHSWFTRLRIKLYQLMVTNARKPMRFFGLPADRTIEINTVRFL